MNPRIRSPCCHTFLAFILKFLNFLQTFIGLSMIIYSVFMLNQWHKHSLQPPPSAPSPDNNPDMVTIFSDFDAAVTPLNIAAGLVSGLDPAFNLNLLALPAPWFIYAFMGVGIILCCISCIGHVAAEAINGCCLCFYTVLTTILLSLESTLLVFIGLDDHWERDLPFDPTGELDSLRGFIEENLDVCNCVGITVVTIQVFSLLLSMILRAMVSAHRVDHDSEGGYDVTRRSWEPLLNPQLTQTSGSLKGEARGAHSDIWSSRMREKYGLNGVNRNSPNQITSIEVKS